MNKKYWLAGIVVVFAIVVYYFMISSSPNLVSEEIAKCIGGKSELYIQDGCIHCENQKKLFGENFKFLNVVDCTDNWDSCPNIQGTPTWIIDSETYLGEQDIEKLRNLTEC